MSNDIAAIGVVLSLLFGLWVVGVLVRLKDEEDAE